MSAIQGIMPLSSLTATSPIDQTNSIGDKNLTGLNGGVQTASGDFSQYLTDALDQVDSLQKEADAASVSLATGEVEDMHTAMVAIEKADLSMSLAVEVRNKALDAYHEMMRMQI